MRKFACALLALLMLICFSGCASYTSSNTKKTPINFDFDKSTSVPTEEIVPTPTPIPAPTHNGGYSEAELEKGSPAVCIIDTETGEVVYKTENYQERKYIASITKLITVITALDYLDVKERVTIKDEWLTLLKTDSSIDIYGLKSGMNMSIGDLFALMLVKSYGDAAESIRYYTEEKTGRDFLELMNEKANAIGMTASHFDNTIGLDIGNDFTENYSSAYDAALLMKEALKYERVRYYASGRDIKIENGTTLVNTNAILHNGTKLENITAICGKTGSTNAAGSTFAIAFKDEKTGKEYAATYIHAKDWTALNSELLYTMQYVLQEMGKTSEN